MAKGKIFHWKHGWIPISPEAKAYIAGQGPRPLSSGEQEKLRQKLDDEGGFTWNARTGGLIEPGKAKGYAVHVPGTEVEVGVEKVADEDITREDFAKGVADVISKHQAELASGNYALGGWYNPETNHFTVQLTKIYPPSERTKAITEAAQAGEPGVFNFETGEITFVEKLNAQHDPLGTLTKLAQQFAPEEIAAAKYYTGPGYKPINRALRFGDALSMSNRFYLDELDSAIAKATVSQDTTVFRGIKTWPGFPKHFAPGEPIIDPGYTSTATNPASHYPGDVKMVIKVPAGSNALDLYAHQVTHHADERELLLPRGTELRVISDVTPTGGGQRIINAEVIPRVPF